MALHRPVERLPADGQVQVPVGHRELERRSSLQPSNQTIDELAPDAIDLDRLGPMDAIVGELTHQLARVPVRVDRDAR